MNTAHTHVSARRLDLHYILMQAGFWAMFASICAFQVGLLQERGFSDAHIGLIIAVRCLTGIFSQPALGGFADRHPEFPLKLLVLGCLLLTLAANVVFSLVHGGLFYTLLISAVFGACEISVYPLVDTLAIQYINAGVPIRYSFGRGIGSLSYGLICIVLGQIATRWGVEYTLHVHSLLIAAECLFVATFPTFPATALPPDSARPKPQSALALLRSQPRFATTLLGVFFLITGLLPMVNFLLQIVVSRGGDNATLGTALFFMAAVELSTGFFFQRLLRRFGSGRLLVVSTLFALLKGVALLLSQSAGAVIAIQLLQAAGYGLFTPTSVYYVNESVPEADRVKGQTLMMVAGNGLGGVAGSLISGWILDWRGVNVMLVVCILFCLLALLLVSLGVRRSAAREAGAEGPHALS